MTNYVLPFNEISTIFYHRKCIKFELVLKNSYFINIFIWVYKINFGYDLFHYILYKRILILLRFLAYCQILIKGWCVLALKINLMVDKGWLVIKWPPFSLLTWRVKEISLHICFNLSYIYFNIISQACLKFLGLLFSYLVEGNFVEVSSWIKGNLNTF